MKLKPLAANQTELAIGGTLILFSYRTPVAAFVPGTGFVRTEELWSRTTSKHITQWLRAHGAGHVETRPQSFFDSLTKGAPNVGYPQY